MVKQSNKDKFLTDKSVNDTDSGNAVTESLDRNDFKDRSISYNVATRRQLESLEKARARKRQLKKFREMREVKNKKAKRALNRLRG